MNWLAVALPKVFFAQNRPCQIDEQPFFGFPPWWKYLDTEVDTLGHCSPAFDFPNDTWAVLFAVIDMLLYVSGIVAVVMIIVSGVGYILSSGNVEKATEARRRAINSLIGLGVVLIAAATVSFIGKSLAG